MGDFNLNLLNYDSNKVVDDFVNDMFSNSLYPLVNKPTNFFQNSSTLIDQAWSNMLHENANCSILNISVSTHKPLLIIMSVSLNHHTNTSAQVKNLRIHDVTEKTIEKFSGEFIHYMDGIKQDLSDITDKNCLRNAFSDFYNNLTDIYNRNIIVDKSLESRRNVYDKPWMSTSLAKCCKEKSRLHNVWIKSRGPSY